MIDQLGQSILHAVVTASFVEALLRAWRVERAGIRLLLRASSLGAVILLSPLADSLAPWRLSDDFASRWALFAGARWNLLELGGVGVARLATGVLSALGSALLLIDLVPAIADLRRRPPVAPLPAPQEVAAETGAMAQEAGMAPPRVMVAPEARPLLLCVGMARPRIVISAGAWAMLDPGERRAALAHELVHARYRDPLAGWALLAVRLLFWFNPVVQIQARAIVADFERRADELGARWSHDPAALASALARLYRATHDVSSPAGLPPGAERLSRGVRRLRFRHLADRCRLLIAPDRDCSDEAVPAVLHLAVAEAALAGLVLFVL